VKSELQRILEQMQPQELLQEIKKVVSSGSDNPDGLHREAINMFGDSADIYADPKDSVPLILAQPGALDPGALLESIKQTLRKML
jgi:hypothetical protein